MIRRRPRQLPVSVERRSRMTAGALVVVAVALTGCGGGTSVRGLVIDVDGDVESVRSFVVQSDNGERFEFSPAPGLRFDSGAPLSHLRGHALTGALVVVVYEEGSDGLIAVRIGDA